MIKIDHRSRLWRGREGRLWRIADRVEQVAISIRYAHKPADLTYTKHALLRFRIEVDELQMEWLETWLKLNPKERGRWPRL